MIPEAAVIAASKALMADKMSNHSGDNAPQIMDACEKVARKVLEAAAPHMTIRTHDDTQGETR